MAAPLFNLMPRLPALREFFRLLYLDGVRSVGLVVLMAAALAAGEVRLMTDSLGLRSAYSVHLQWLVSVRVLGPLLVPVVFIARSGAAIAVSVGEMAGKGEWRGLRRQGINPFGIYVLPCTVAGSLSCMLLLCYWLATGVIISVVSSPNFDVLGELDLLFSQINGIDMVLALLRAGLCGAVASLITCWWGSRAELNDRDQGLSLPSLVSEGVLQALVAVLLLDLLSSTLIQPITLTSL